MTTPTRLAASLIPALTSDQQAALSLVRSSAYMDGATRRECRDYATALNIPTHLQVAAYTGKTDEQIAASIAEHNQRHAELVRYTRTVAVS